MYGNIKCTVDYFFLGLITTFEIIMYTLQKILSIALSPQNSLLMREEPSHCFTTL